MARTVQATQMEDVEMPDAEVVVVATPPYDLLKLPHEILQNLFENCDATSLARLSRTGSTLHDFIYDNDLLWKNVYLQTYDEPRECSEEQEWKSIVQSVIAAQKILNCSDPAVKRAARVPVGKAILRLLHTTSSDRDTSRNLRILQRAFDTSRPEGFVSLGNQDAFLCGSSLFGLLRGDDHGSEDRWYVPEAEDERQLLAQLHCLYGVPKYGWSTGDAEQDTHAYARARVYDLERYTEQTMWGPFKDDPSGEVDWEKMEAIITVLAYNLQKFSDQTNGRYRVPWKEEDAWFGASPYSFIKTKVASESGHRLRSSAFACGGKDAQFLSEYHEKLALQDPYGITGTWHRVVCFLDYYDFFHFNFRQNVGQFTSKTFLDNEEAIRLILMRCRVENIEHHSDGRRPTVSFTGDSQSMGMHPGDPHANSDLEGVVQETAEGEIRWTTWSLYSGERRWRSESIQVGGVQSARGVIGNWFDTDYDQHGPAGPTAFWKVSDSVHRKNW